MELQSKGIKAFSGCLISRKPKRTKIEPGLVVGDDNNNSGGMLTHPQVLTNNLTNYEQINLNQTQPIQNLNCINSMNSVNAPNMNINIIAQQQIIQNHHYNSDYVPVSNDIYSSNPNNVSFHTDSTLTQTYQLNPNFNSQSMGTLAQTNSVYYTWSNNQMPNQMTSSTLMSDQIIDGNNSRMMTLQQPKLQQQHQQQQQINQVCIEDLLEDSIKCKIKVIHQSYTEYLSNLVDVMNNELLKTSMFNNNMNYQNYQPHVSGSVAEILRCLNFYAKKVLSFSQNIPGLSVLSSEDKEELVKCSIHSIILLSIQRRCNHLNYFNCDPAKFERFLKKLPNFSVTTCFMKSVREKFDKYKLDDKEYALYSALILISTSCQNLNNYDQVNEIRENIGNALRKYMIGK